MQSYALDGIFNRSSIIYAMMTGIAVIAAAFAGLFLFAVALVRAGGTS